MENKKNKITQNRNKNKKIKKNKRKMQKQNKLAAKKTLINSGIVNNRIWWALIRKLEARSSRPFL